MPGVSPALARSKPGQWLLEFEIGRVLRFAERAVDIETRDGEILHFSAGLAPFTLGTSVGGEASIGFAIDAGEAVRASALNWAALVAEGIDLEERSGTLYRHFEGQLLEECRVWLKGRTKGAEYGGEDQPTSHLSISLERRPTKGNTVPGPQERADLITWPVNAGATLDDAINGAAYPIIIGAPGHSPTGVPDPAVPVLFVEVQAAGNDDRLLIATGRVEADEIQLYDASNSPALTTRREVKVMQDNLGRTVSYVDLMPPFALAATEGAKYYAGFQANSSIYGGGTIDPRTGRMVRGLVDVIEFMLVKNGTPVDFGRMAALRSRWNSMYFDSFINTPVNAYDWLRSEILSLVNLVEREGDLGLYYGAEIWDANEQDVTVRFDVDLGAWRQTAPLVLRRQGEIYNEFTIEYRPYLTSGRFLSRRILTGTSGVLGDAGDAGVGTDSRVIADLRCALSQRRFRTALDRSGVRPAPPIRAASVRDDATAVRILKDRAARDALPKRVTQVTAGPEAEWVEEGAIGLLINSAAGLGGNICRVDNVTVGDGLTVCDLTLLDDPIQTPRLTG